MLVASKAEKLDDDLVGLLVFELDEHGVEWRDFEGADKMGR